VSIVSLRINVGGAWYSSRAIQAVDYAIESGIDILNYSGRTRNEETNVAPYDDPILAQSILMFPGLFIAAAGNEYTNNDDTPNFPANYSLTHDNVISVGAIDVNSDKPGFSNYGINSVSIYAPGVNIRSTIPGGYAYYDGTSMAAPYVTGVAALLLSIDSSLTSIQLRNAIFESSDIINIDVNNGDTQSVRKLNAYSAVKFVLENYSNTPYTLSNYSNSINTNKTIAAGNTYFNEKNGFYKLNVTYAKDYEFIISSTKALDVTLYDEDFNELNTNDLSSDNLKTHIIHNLAVGTYYLRVSYQNENDSGIINTKIVSRNTVYLNYNQNDILVNTYNGIDDYYYINTKGAGFYEFKLNGTKADGTTPLYPEGAITLYNDSNKTTPMEKFNLTGYLNSASTKSNENSMIVYLPRNGYFYIDVNISSDNLSSLFFEVTSPKSQEIDLFDFSESTNQSINIFNETIKGDYFEKIVIDQTGKFTINTMYAGQQEEDILLVLAKLNYSTTTYTYTLETRMIELINKDNIPNPRTLTLLDGIYYIGYFNKNDTSSLSVSLNRLVSQSGSHVLVTDPDSATPSGSQINIIEMNNSTKSYRQSFITKNFTRLIYPDYNYDVSASRLDYHWYSSNENIATVTDFGTVLGKNVGTVKIMAVLKEDPSKVFVKEFTIIEDTGTEPLVVESTLTVKYSETDNGTFKLNLEKVNCPYPWFQDYIWNVFIPEQENDINIVYYSWGHFTVNNTGNFVLTGKYLKNSRVTVIINVIVEP